ncbi:MAG: hypothetical protein IPO61_07155 [Gammaproteobacteria bacterium]|nr:hypothetical protein [Gammaproteobacteria bacterium]
MKVSSRVLPYDVVIVGGILPGCAVPTLAPLGHDVLLVEAAALSDSLPPLAATIAEVDPRVSAPERRLDGLMRGVGAWDLIPPQAELQRGDARMGRTAAVV